MKIRNFIIFVLINILIAINSNAQNIDKNISEQLVIASNEINKNLPKIIDKDTQLDSTGFFGNTFISTYTLINLKSHQVTEDMKKFLYNQVVNGYCSGIGDMKLFKDNNIVLNVNYRGIDGKFATAISVNASKCK